MNVIIVDTRQKPHLVLVDHFCNFEGQTLSGVIAANHG